MNKYINKIICGDSVKVLSTFPDKCIDLTVTSPPYEALRDYNNYTFDYKSMLSSLYRVTKEGGIVVWVVNDQTIKGSESGESFKQALYAMDTGFKLHDTMIYEKDGPAYPSHVKSIRYSSIFEYMFVFSKGKPKTVNLIVDKPNKWAGTTSWGISSSRQVDGSLKKTGKIPVADLGVRNNIWKYSVGANKSTSDKIAYKHPAIFPEKLCEDHILSWSNPHDIVLDPMAGSFTTAKMAFKNCRSFIGIDMSMEYCLLGQERLKQCFTEFEIIDLSVIPLDKTQII